MKRFGVAVLLAFVVPALWAQDDSLSFEKFPEQDADDSDGALIDDDLIQPRNKRGDGDYYSDAWGGSEDDHPDERSPNIDTEPEMGSGEEDDLQPDTEGEGSVETPVKVLNSNIVDDVSVKAPGSSASDNEPSQAGKEVVPEPANGSGWTAWLHLKPDIGFRFFSSAAPSTAKWSVAALASVVLALAVL
ncbi:hypothetical protein AAVH_22651 [Aphelenchoides avenae]|nr:hypothetical protein AAVH_22651 [Aphelenchus avenae]